MIWASHASLIWCRQRVQLVKESWNASVKIYIIIKQLKQFNGYCLIGTIVIDHDNALINRKHC